ncbi:hypothetical protein O5404_03675 [Borrelia miyamotoi]|uniref:Tetratricopeptide repeat protein n=1 Tax=Borrelia miyamotoi TaxID=47466 RepID=A0AAX3JMX4_9SPIR|nr:hypothetical protein [Borrelia miyamotoi]QFP48286.2 hypothetical protein F9Y91_03600 [Borrelia miyamotoi]WAZ72093.1 hypothetical protein O5404_03675 [Borrelia miyamotoi]
MFKNKFFIGILAVIVFFGVIAFFYDSVDVDYVKTGGEVVEELERDLNIYLRSKDKEEKRKLEFKIEAAISDKHDIAYEFIPRFYLARSTYFQNKGLYKKAIDDLDMIIDSKWIERDLAYINKAVIYEKMGQPENALLIYDDVIKQTRLDFIKIRALLSKAALIEVRDKKLAVEIYEKISNFSYENNLYINLAKNKLLQLR